jgi:hypothetical protein
MPKQFRCAICGQRHDDLPDVGSPEPYHYLTVPKEERDRRTQLTADTCIIDDEDFFIRGVIEIPIHDHPQRFGFGVWVSQRKQNFEAYRRDPDSAAIGPFFGWLCTRIDFYPVSTLALKTMAHFRDGGLRPSIVLEPTDHPLAVDQRKGIPLSRAWEIVHWYERRAEEEGERRRKGGRDRSV